MENRRGRGLGGRSNTREAVYEDFQPIADWANDSNSHVLLVDLPGFKKEELKIVENNGRLTVSGERQLSENRYKRFKQVYSLPIDSDPNKISGKFDGGLLLVTVPKKENEIQEEPKEQHPVAEGIAEEPKQETSKAEEKPKEEEPKQATTTPEEKPKEKERNQDTTTPEEKPKEEERNQDTTTPEEKPKKDGKDTDVQHDNSNVIREERKTVESKKNEVNGGLSECRREKEEKGFKFGSAERAIEMVARNKGMVLAAILGLTVGIYLSRKLRSTVM